MTEEEEYRNLSHMLSYEELSIKANNFQVRKIPVYTGMTES